MRELNSYKKMNDGKVKYLDKVVDRLVKETIISERSKIVHSKSPFSHLSDDYLHSFRFPWNHPRPKVDLILEMDLEKVAYLDINFYYSLVNHMNNVYGIDDKDINSVWDSLRNKLRMKSFIS